MKIVSPHNPGNIFHFLLPVFILGMFSSCTLESHDTKTKQKILKEELRERGEVVVLTRNAPTTYYSRSQGKAGMEYDMVNAFAAHLGITPRFKVFANTAELFRALEQGEGDFIAAGVTITPERQDQYRFGPPYQHIQQEVVCHRQSNLPRTPAELSRVNIVIASSSSYEDRLNELRNVQTELQWVANDQLSTEEIFHKVAKREFDCTIADSHIVAINQRFFPNLVVAMPVSEEQQLAWLLPRDAEGLNGLIETWFATMKEARFFENVHHRYYAHIDVFDYVDTKRFYRHSRNRLPRYETVFQQAAETHNLPWTLLAAQGYQESHWNPKAKSPTGVRGIMMLTRNTAAELGIRNRLNPTKSIRGGARYLNQMKTRLPEDIQEPDRTWFALAAYNVGFGHLRDAMNLARQLEKDPYTWKNLKTVLPLLSRKTYYQHLPHGYARGTEPVRYVDRVRHYQDMLERQEREI
ncbi:MAG: membrane-bound lytic murein transglycosylase MltF [Nitrospirales bacterium]